MIDTKIHGTIVIIHSNNSIPFHLFIQSFKTKLTTSNPAAKASDILELMYYYNVGKL